MAFEHLPKEMRELIAGGYWSLYRTVEGKLALKVPPRNACCNAHGPAEEVWYDMQEDGSVTGRLDSKPAIKEPVRLNR